MTEEETLNLVQQYLVDANAENASGTHRGVVLVWASIIDDLLLRITKAHVVPLNSEMRDDLFGPMGPLGSFSSRTKILHALGIIKRDEMNLIDEVRSIRNKFAHHLGITLDDKDLAVRCIAFGNTLHGTTGNGDPKLKFTGGCGTLLTLLLQRLRKTETAVGIVDDRPLPDRSY